MMWVKPLVSAHSAAERIALPLPLFTVKSRRETDSPSSVSGPPSVLPSFTTRILSPVLKAFSVTVRKVLRLLNVGMTIRTFIILHVYVFFPCCCPCPAACPRSGPGIRAYEMPLPCPHLFQMDIPCLCDC